ncbi:hypothetical protein CBR_g50726 [Chara braunii]|nr:hypothetical protein CBR_g50726 [Chara braunii]|eukprot:GBG65365.1 hypothetical protein CBR_g50726 [Chara braunii]
MGGIGKTTLAKLVNNDTEIREHFTDGVFWEVVGFDRHRANPSALDVMKSLHQTLHKAFKSSKSRPEDFNPLDVDDGIGKLKKALQGKCVLLIIDDVWKIDSIDWIHDVISDTGRVLITTRNEQVLSRPGVGVHRLGLLDDDSAQELFRWYAFCRFRATGHRVPPNLEPLVVEVCHECKGLPLALKVIGSSMSGIFDREEWRRVLHKLRTATPLDTPAFKESLMAVLTASFTDLSPVLQNMFLDLATYPEDCEIPVAPFLEMWATDAGIEDTKEAEWLLKQLELRSLITRDRPSFSEAIPAPKFPFPGTCGSCSVHDVLRDMALQIIRDGCGMLQRKRLYISPLELQQLPNFSQGHARVEAKVISFLKPKMRRDISHLQDKGHDDSEIQIVERLFAGCETPNVEMVFIGAANQFSAYCNSSMTLANTRRHTTVDTRRHSTSRPTINRILGALCRPSSTLRVLWLPDCGFECLPDAISCLKGLRYLGLPGCADLKSLPDSLGELESLQALDLSGCGSLRQVPPSIGNLKHLKSVSFIAEESALPIVTSEDRTSSDIHFVNLMFDLPCLETLRLQALDKEWDHLRLAPLANHCESLRELWIVLAVMVEDNVLCGKGASQ